MMINSEEKKIKGEEYHEIKGEPGLCGVCNHTKCHSFSDWDITAAFEGIATGRGFDVGLSYNIIFHLSSSQSRLHLSQAISALDEVRSL